MISNNQQLLSILAFIAFMTIALGCDDFSHDAIVNTPPPNYVTLLVSKTEGGDSADSWNDVEPWSGSGLAAVGATSTWGSGSGAVYFVAMNSGREVVWSKFYGGFGHDHGADILRTASGNYLIVGGTSSFDLVTGEKPGPNTHPGFDFEDQNFYMLMADADGGLLWEKAAGDTLQFERATSAVASGNDFLVAGTIGRSGGDEDLALFRVTSGGEILWQINYPAPAMGRFTKIAATTDGNYVMAGHGLYGSVRLRDSHMIKVNDAGDPIWEKTFGWAGSQEKIFAVLATGNGVVACGSSIQNPGTDSAVELLYLLNVDLDGNVIWENTYEQASLGQGRSIVAKAGNSFLVCGQNDATGSIHVASIGADGQLNWSDETGVTGESMAMTPSSRGFAVVGYFIQSRPLNQTDALLIEFAEDFTNIE